MLCRCSVGRRLYLSWAGLLFEDGIVAKAVAFALLAVSTRGMGLVALGANVSVCTNNSCRAARSGERHRYR
jgi:hypothetical protein